jgi:hypothetical protein
MKAIFSLVFCVITFTSFGQYNIASKSYWKSVLLNPNVYRTTINLSVIGFDDHKKYTIRPDTSKPDPSKPKKVKGLRYKVIAIEGDHAI